MFFIYNVFITKQKSKFKISDKACGNYSQETLLVQAAKFPKDLLKLAYCYLFPVQECVVGVVGVFNEFILEIDNWVE